jgi:hypothetical protein
MPRIKLRDLPPELLRHLFDRAKERAISLCGEGQYPKTFLLSGQAAHGREIE